MPGTKRHTNWIDVLVSLQAQYPNALLSLKDNTNITRQSRVIGKCQTEQCKNEFECSLRKLHEDSAFACHVCAMLLGKQKARMKCMQKFGVQHPLQRAEIREQIRQTCTKKYGVENPSQIAEVKEKKKKTCLQTNGVEYALQSAEIKEKKKQTMLQMYGVEHATQSTEIKEKKKQTMLQRYGVEHASQSTEIKEKTRQTCFANHGVDCSFQSADIREKGKQTIRQKYGVENPSQSAALQIKKKQTFMARYGVEHSMQSPAIREKSKETSMKNYGVEYPMHNHEYAEKVSKNSFHTKKYTLPSGNVINVQGYESYALDYLLHTENVHEDDIVTSRKEVPECWYHKDGKNHRYYVDIYIPTQNRCIEVKSTWTYAKKGKDHVYAKLNALKHDGFNVELWVYNDKKQCTCEMI